MRKIILLPLLVVGLAAATPAGADDQSAGITAVGFMPAVISIQNGDRVVWKNTDATARQIVADDGSFKSGMIQPGGSYAHIFPFAGSYPFHDGTRAAEKGTVQVSDTRSVSIQSQARTVLFNRAVTLSGTVATTAPGSTDNQRVTILAKPAGSTTFTRVATTTTDHGQWNVLVRPGRNTAYEAVWKNVPSSTESVLVKPLVRLKQTGRRLFSVGVHADANLRYHRVSIQRWVAKRHVWKTLRSVRLTKLRASQTEVVVTGVFRMRAAHGTILRALLTNAQASPAQYGPSASASIRV
jgi:plastocyanin